MVVREPGQHKVQIYVISLSLSLSACPINAVGEQICITRTRALMQIARFTEFLIILYLFTNEIADRKQQNKSEKTKRQATTSSNYTLSQKTRHQTLAHNFTKY